MDAILLILLFESQDHLYVWLFKYLFWIYSCPCVFVQSCRQWRVKVLTIELILSVMQNNISITQWNYLSNQSHREMPVLSYTQTLVLSLKYWNAYRVNHARASVMHGNACPVNHIPTHLSSQSNSETLVMSIIQWNACPVNRAQKYLYCRSYNVTLFISII